MRLSVLTGLLICLAGAAGETRAAELPFYASVGVSLSQTNGLAETDVPPPTFFIGDPGEFPQFPDELPLAGLPFDDDDSGFSAALGYQFTKFFAVELGYQDLGSFQARAPIVSAFGALPVPATLDASGLSLGAQFGFPLTERLRATWHLKIVRAEFEATGDAVIGFLPGPIPGPPPSVAVVPYADPDDETGYGFGFGVSWAFNEHFEAELAYSRQDLQVLEFDSFGLRLIGRL